LRIREGIQVNSSSHSSLDTPELCSGGSFITIALYLKKKCISPNLLLLNGGLIFAGVPFQSVQGYATYFLVIGGTVALVGLLFFVREKIQGRKCHYENI
jgi:hypothetical protein